MFISVFILKTKIKNKTIEVPYRIGKERNGFMHATQWHADNKNIEKNS